MKIINIGGAINSGKSTVSKILTEKLSNSIFIEVDDLLSDEEAVQFLDFHEKINERLNRLYAKLEQYIKNKEYDYIIFAYPMVDKTFDKITKITESQVEFIIITLNPPLEKCLVNRGTRELDNWEINRVREMYEKGYNSFHKSDLILDNGNESAVQTANTIANFIFREKKHPN